MSDTSRHLIRRSLHRHEARGQARYLTFSCYHRLPLFDNDRIKDAFADTLTQQQAALDIAIHAWVIMPEHIHLLVTPDPPRVTARRLLTAIKSPFSRRVLARWRELNAPVLLRLSDTSSGKTRFWQPGGGYDRNIYTREELIEKANYTHQNPARRGLVQRPEDWAWSSARFYASHPYQGPTITRI